MKNSLKKQLRDFSFNEDINLKEFISFIDYNIEDLIFLIKKLENEEELDKEIVYDVFNRYKELLEIHKQMYVAANNLISNENEADELWSKSKKDIMYG